MLARCFLTALILAFSSPLFCAESAPILATAEQFARTQTRGLPGKIIVTMGTLDASRLPPCTAHQAYAPPGMRLSGRTYIGVRCIGPSNWSVLVPARIAVVRSYVTTARALAAGQTIQTGDLATLNGDISTLPAGVITDPATAIGKTLRNSLGPGQPLRSNQLLSPLVIRQGQTVRVITEGPGFSVSGEGKAINNAAEGEIAQIRLKSGQTVSGTARADGSVEISF